MVLYHIKNAIIIANMDYHNFKMNPYNLKNIIITNHFMQILTLQILFKSIHYHALIDERVIFDQNFCQKCPPPTLSQHYLQTSSGGIDYQNSNIKKVGGTILKHIF